MEEVDLSRWGFVVTCRFTLNWEPIRVGCHESEHVGPSSIVGEACDFVSQLQIVMMLKRHDQKSGDALRNSHAELFCSMMAAAGSIACGVRKGVVWGTDGAVGVEFGGWCIINKKNIQYQKV